MFFLRVSFILCGKIIYSDLWKNVEKFHTILRCIFEKNY